MWKGKSWSAPSRTGVAGCLGQHDGQSHRRGRTQNGIAVQGTVLAAPQEWKTVDSQTASASEIQILPAAATRW